MNEETQKPQGFSDLNLSKNILEALNKLGFTTPTPIQEKAIPLGLKGKDVIGIAQTGTGKTLAFTLPMIQRIGALGGKGLILVPTRELAHQVREEIEKVGSKIGIQSVLLIGGAAMEPQIYKLKKNPHIIVATPGRMIDHLERRTIKLHDVQTLVLDEADRMLDMGFTPQINRILETVPAERQTLLFSATMASGVAKIAHSYMREPVKIEVTPTGTSAKNIVQGIYYVEQDRKFELLESLIAEHKDELVMVFCRTKHGTKKMAHTLNKNRIKTEELHSNRSLNQRRNALENFKNRKSHVLIATDVAARGIDVKEIALVVNYDLPEQLEDYVHRIGRTGRAGHTGKAVSFATPGQFRDVKSIERIVGREIPALESQFAVSTDRMASMKNRHSAGGSGGSSGRRYGGGGGRGGSRGFAQRGGGGSRGFGSRDRNGSGERDFYGDRSSSAGGRSHSSSSRSGGSGYGRPSTGASRPSFSRSGGGHSPARAGGSRPGGFSRSGSSARSGSGAQGRSGSGRPASRNWTSSRSA